MLMQKGSAALDGNVLLPRRYGTAFHVDPPWSSVRDISIHSSITDGCTMQAWEDLAESDQLAIMGCGLHDPYYLWHLAHAQQLETRVVRVPEGESETLRVEARGSVVWWVVLEKGSQLFLEDCGDDSPSVLRRFFVWQKEESMLRFFAIRSGHTFVRDAVDVVLLGAGAQAELTHLVYGQTSFHADMGVSVTHLAPDTRSRLTVRSALDGGRAIYRGLVKVTRQAPGANGYQHGKTLLLSEGSVADVLPELEIATNNVKCSHGVTTAFLDDAALFYLRSRGLTRAQARRMALLGFYHHQLHLPRDVNARLRSRLPA
jgi:hypothetical protein